MRNRCTRIASSLAARGIGRAIALALADAGADVLITYKGNTAAANAATSNSDTAVTPSVARSVASTS